MSFPSPAAVDSPEGQLIRHAACDTKRLRSVLCSAKPLGGIAMREARVTLPELALIGGTRVALGAGLGLLLADRLPADQRRAVGWTLFLVGALSTVPLAIEVLGKYKL